MLILNESAHDFLNVAYAHHLEQTHGTMTSCFPMLVVGPVYMSGAADSSNDADGNAAVPSSCDVLRSSAVLLPAQSC
jgi:hypothetical protein